MREPNEWVGGVAYSAKMLALSDLIGCRSEWNRFLAHLNGREILLYCAVGGRSGIATRILTREGYQTANAGWPISKRSLERSQ